MESNQNEIFQTFQKYEYEEEIIDFSKLSEEEKRELIFKSKTPLKKLLPNGFINNLDPNFKYFCKLIKKSMCEENYELIGLTAYAGYGKSQLGSLIGCQIDNKYNYSNINFIPTPKEVENDFLKLPPYSFLHIDEASRAIHKHKWYEKTQQKLSELYDTDREGHYHCTCLIMPRFQNFTENFRNFFIKYWINIVARGIAMVYRRDEDKDTKDPWNIEYNIKLKKKYWKSKRIFERTVSDIIRIEQRTPNYWFYFQIPEIPKDIWLPYKYVKYLSRVRLREDKTNLDVEDYRDRLERQKMERWKEEVKLRNEGKTYDEIAVFVGKSVLTIKRDFKEIRTYNQVKGTQEGLQIDESKVSNSNNNIYNLSNNDKNNGIPVQFDKI